MTENQQAFADYYLADDDFDVPAAYMRAYPNVKKRDTASKAGSRLLKNVEVKAYIDKKLEEIKSKRTADIEECFEFLTSVMRGEVKEEKAFVVSQGGFASGSEIEKEMIRTSAKDRIKAAELLIKKHCTGKTDDEGNDIIDNFTPVLGMIKVAIEGNPDE